MGFVLSSFGEVILIDMINCKIYFYDGIDFNNLLKSQIMENSTND